jgi:hypothetical protein
MKKYIYQVDVVDGQDPNLQFCLLSTSRTTVVF